MEEKKVDYLWRLKIAGIRIIIMFTPIIILALDNANLLPIFHDNISKEKEAVEYLTLLMWIAVIGLGIEVVCALNTLRNIPLKEMLRNKIMVAFFVVRTAFIIIAIAALHSINKLINDYYAMGYEHVMLGRDKYNWYYAYKKGEYIILEFEASVLNVIGLVYVSIMIILALAGVISIFIPKKSNTMVGNSDVSVEEKTEQEKEKDDSLDRAML